jgi:putative ABC transport system permease protein
MIISMSTLTKRFNPGIDNQWGNYGCSSYVLMKPGTNALAMQSKFPAFLEKHNGQEMRKSQMYATIFIEKLKDVYLRSTRDGSNSGNIKMFIFFPLWQYLSC